VQERGEWSSERYEGDTGGTESNERAESKVGAESKDGKDTCFGLIPGKG
jgi:hypothetical protein